jgi:dihydroxycyclohexadiene carboxylate dehydrogenase
MSEAIKQVTESTFSMRYGSLDEQVAPILFLTSDEAGYITGTVLPAAALTRADSCRRMLTFAIQPS